MVDNYNSSSDKLITSRLRSFDMLKLFAIILVIWGHCIQYFLSSNYVDEPMYRFIYSFHMPLFMVISGYFATPSMNLNPIRFFVKKNIRLLLPCISWGILIWLVVDVGYPLSRQSSPSLNQLLYSLVFGFWFLKSTLLCYMIAYCGIKSRMSKLIWIPVTLLVCKFIAMYNIEYMYPCFLLGMALNKIKNRWQDKTIFLFIISLIVFFILLIFWDKSFWQPVPSLRSAFFDRNIIPYLAFAYKFSYRIAIGVFGSLTFIFLFHVLFSKDQRLKLIDLCCSYGQYTLEIYIVQTIIVEMIMAKYIILDDIGFIMFNFVIAPFLTILILIVCVMVIKVIYKFKFFSFWLFGKK